MGAVPHLTTEMNQEQEEEMPDKAELIQELRAVKVPPQKDWTPPTQEATQEVTEMSELKDIRETLGVDETANPDYGERLKRLLAGCADIAKSACTYDDGLTRS